MALVDYSDSDDEAGTRPAKRTKPSTTHGGPASNLPPLPAAFRDLYSSAVRTSTEDDPSLHAGRIRTIPHVAGNWSAHVYLEWSPKLEDYILLSRVVDQVRKSFVTPSGDIEAASDGKTEVHSLLENALDVCLPLHVSLSRPLVLKTDQKDAFLHQLSTALAATHACAFATNPLNLAWHPNEDRTRWFLVLSLQCPPGDEFRKLLKSCNAIASRFGQPLLYQDGLQLEQPVDPEASSTLHHSFHVSIAWSLRPHGLDAVSTSGTLQHAVDPALRDSLRILSTCFSEVKVRIGQQVSSFPLRGRRTVTPSDFGNALM